MAAKADTPSGLRAACLRVGLLTASGFAAYTSLVHWVLKPLHTLGYGQAVVGFLNGLDHLLGLPGLFVAEVLRLRAEYLTLPSSEADHPF